MTRAVSKEQFEKLAQGVAGGLSIGEAVAAAGYELKSGALGRLAKNGKFRDRVAGLKRGWGETADLAPVIDELMDGASRAVRANNPGAARLNAAARLLNEAGRLKRQLPSAPWRGRLTDVLDEEMSADEWAARYGPES